MTSGSPVDVRKEPVSPARAGVGEVFTAFLTLGLTSFGGPIAHLGYFRAEFVERRRWLTEASYADLVALSQFLPGPASSQTGFAIGMLRAGYPGALAAWLGFTLPSALLMLLFAWGAPRLADTVWGNGLLHGLKLAAVAIVAQAVLGMARSLCPDRTRSAIAVAAILVLLIVPGSFGQLAAIALGGIAGRLFCDKPSTSVCLSASPAGKRVGAICLALFLALLAVAFMPAGKTVVGLVGAFYRSGALVFGGGHVVLPLLRDAVVAPAWISDNAFLAGYGAAQALPGPLFAFATFLGAASVPPGGVVGALVATIAIFLPGLLIMTGSLSFWRNLQAAPSMRAAMQGLNAAVVGLLAAALYDPVWTSAIGRRLDFAVAAGAFVLLIAWRARPLLVVAMCGLTGLVFGSAP